MKILIFSGAGASVQFGIPTTKEFKSDFWKSRTTRDDNQRKLFEYEGFPDIEYVLESLREIKEFKTKTISSRFLSTLSEQCGNYNREYFASLFNSLGTYDVSVLEYLFKRFKIEETQKENLVNFFDSFFDLIKEFDNSSIEIATTNYDLSVETFCGYLPSKYSCVDGFTKIHDQFLWSQANIESLEDREHIGTPVRLYKIHGSLNWQKHGSLITKVENIGYYQEGSEYESVLIAPTLSPKTASNKEPFSTILDLFSKQIKKVDVCIVLGSSFRDDIINSPLREFLARKGNLIIISPSCYQNYSVGLLNQNQLKDKTRMVEWTKADLQENKRKVSFIDLALTTENNFEIFSKLKQILVKIKASKSV